MSAFIVDKEQIDFLVTALLDNGLIPPTDAHKIGTELWRENVISVTWRYIKDHEMLEYSFKRFEHELEPHYVLKQIDFYNYQSCEHPTWEQSHAYMLMCQLRDVIYTIQGYSGDEYKNTSEYENAPWGVDMVRLMFERS